MATNTEIKEITSFIDAFDFEKDGHSGEIPLKRMTYDIDEEFLETRAKILKSAYQTDFIVKECLEKLSSICNEEYRECRRCPVNKYCNTYIAEARMNIPADALTMVDLFCGAGGL